MTILREFDERHLQPARTTHFLSVNLEVEDSLKKDAAVSGRGGAEESPSSQGLRFAEELVDESVPFGIPRF